VDFFKAVVIVNSRAFEPLTMYTLLAFVYFICCYALSRLVRFIDPKYEVVA
jgi:ABC-type amino acid transport system permease subunit